LQIQHKKLSGNKMWNQRKVQKSRRDSAATQVERTMCRLIVEIYLAFLHKW
jgi:hypothetical protein